jgi:hypothetical protein
MEEFESLKGKDAAAMLFTMDIFSLTALLIPKTPTKIISIFLFFF